MTTAITRENFGKLLGAGKIEVSIGGDVWATIRRIDGWAFTYSLPGGTLCTGHVDEGDFVNGALLPHLWRAKP